MISSFGLALSAAFGWNRYHSASCFDLTAHLAPYVARPGFKLDSRPPHCFVEKASLYRSPVGRYNRPEPGGMPYQADEFQQPLPGGLNTNSQLLRCGPDTLTGCDHGSHSHASLHLPAKARLVPVSLCLFFRYDGWAPPPAAGLTEVRDTEERHAFLNLAHWSLELIRNLGQRIRSKNCIFGVSPGPSDCVAVPVYA